MQYKHKSQVQRMDSLFSSLSNSLIRTGLPSALDVPSIIMTVVLPFQHQKERTGSYLS